MKSSLLKSSLIALAVAALAVLPAQLQAQTTTNKAAASKKATTDKTDSTAKKAHPFHGKLASVDKTAKTITLEGKEKARVFLITSETRIRKDRKPATLDDVQLGERVGGSARENAAGKMEVVTLNVGLAARGAKAKEGDSNPAKQ